MQRVIRPKDLLNPERILSNLIKDYTEGKLSSSTYIYRAVVVNVDHVGGALEPQPPNPKGSIRARVVTAGIDTYTRIDNLPVFWPINPHHITPIKEGEHVYVFFEDEARLHGMWICRCPDQLTTDNLNLTPGSKKYEDNTENELNGVGLQDADQDTEGNDAVPIKVSSELAIEQPVPLTPRVGDHVIHGSNNTVIVLGRDRPKDVGSGILDEAGTIDIVAGRSTPENMDMDSDKSRIYVSMKTDVDGNFGIQVGQASGPSAAIVIKSDQIRIVGRSGMKIVVDGGDVLIDGATILAGSNAQDPAMLGQKFATAIGPLLDALSGPAVGVLGQVPVPPNPAVATAAAALKAALIPGNILSQKNKVE